MAVCAFSILTLTAISGGCADQNQQKFSLGIFGKFREPSQSLDIECH